MQKHIDDIVSKLPNGISQTGMKEIIDLVEAAINQQVDEQVTLLESKVSGFLRTKIESLKEVAQQEFELENSNYRATKIYETIKTLVAGDISEKDFESATAPYKSQVEELESKIETMNETYSQTENQNRLLEGQVNQLKHEVEDLINENNGLEKNAKVLTEQASLPFKTSETAVVITNNNDADRSSSSAEHIDNRFLTEDVVRLSNLLKEEN
jgi:prefoldin subunit 5